MGIAAVLLLLLQDPGSLPPGADLTTWRMLEEDLRAPRHPGDGGGQARLVAGPRDGIPAGSVASWTFRYTAGPLGVREGGAVFFQAPAFWGWSPPVLDDEEAPGFLRARSLAEGCRLEVAIADRGLVAFHVRGRELRPGEEIEVIYGAGPAGAVADRFAEDESPFWFAVDADGDGVRALVPDPPRVRIVAGEAARIHAVLPVTAEPGQALRLHLAVLDRAGNAGVPFEGSLQVAGHVEELGAPEEVHFQQEDRGLRILELVPRRPGVFRLEFRGPGGLEGRSNRVAVRPGAPRILWADLQVHTALSDGTGTPEQVLAYARDVAGLDAVALTDHDHWGFGFLDRDPAAWRRVLDAVAAAHEPGVFVALPGFEWTHWLYGHRHVLYFQDEAPLFSALDPRTGTPDGLWSALEGFEALTVAHHSAGAPVPVDWSWAPPPGREPVTEIVSVHGSSEAPDCPGLVRHPLPGHFVRDQLDAGRILGFIGSGDGHDGHPGLTHLASPSGGLAAILARDRTREAILEALRARRCYATNGPRILLGFEAGGWPMGSILPPSSFREGLECVMRVAAPSPVRRLELIRSGTVVLRVDASGREVFHLRETVQGLRDGEYLYVRVLLEDGGMAWSSPVFLREEAD